MAKFKVVTDSSVHLTQAEIDQYGITILPLSTLLDGQVYQDGSEVEKNVFLDKMRESQELPKTSQPAIGFIVDTYNDLTEDGSDILSIHVTHTLSGTVNGAAQAAQISEGDRKSVV